MEHQIVRSLSEVSLLLLSELVGKEILNIAITTAGHVDLHNGCQHNMGFLIVLETDQQEIVISSDSVQSDGGIEFPQLYATSREHFSDPDELFDERESSSSSLGYSWDTKRLSSINIIRDRVRWEHEGQKWELNLDIGIKLKFDHVELLVMARDSSLGLLEIWIGNSLDWTDERQKYAEIYSFDSNELQQIERVETNLGNRI